MLTLSRIHEQFLKSVKHLASTEGSLRERLRFVHAQYLNHLSIDTPPSELAVPLAEIMSAFQSSLGLLPTVDEMEEDAVIRLAQRVVSMFIDLAHRDPDHMHHPRWNTKDGASEQRGSD